MGLCVSSRKVTIDNTDTDVLKVSAKVIARLRQENLTKGSKKPGPLDLETTIEIGKSLHYWKGRLDKTRANQQAINQRLQEQYEKTYRKYDDEVPSKKSKKTGADQMKKMKAALIKCYKSNQKKSLNCAKEVDNFNNWFEENKNRIREEEKKRKEEEEAKRLQTEEKMKEEAKKAANKA